MVGIEERSQLKGELFSANVKARSDTESAVQATRRHLIQNAVDFPAGSSTGVLGQTRPLTVKEKHDMMAEANYILAQTQEEEHEEEGKSRPGSPLDSEYSPSQESLGPSSPMSQRSGIGSPMSRGIGSPTGNLKTAPSLKRMATKKWEQRAVHSRREAERQKRLHYETVRLRSEVSALMDAVIFRSGGAEERDRIADALATTLSAYLDLDATNPLSLFPGILEMLLILLEDSDCGEAAAACSAVLARLVLAGPEVRQAMLVPPNRGEDEGQEAGRGHLEVLGRVIANAKAETVKVECAKVVVGLCSEEGGRDKCEAAGLVALLREAAAAEDEGEDAEGEGQASAALKEILHELGEPSGSGESWEAEEEDAAGHDSKAESLPSRSSSTTGPKKKEEESTAQEERKAWKPLHLPVWERPAMPRGMTGKWKAEKSFSASQRHLE